jgi:transcriptional regulator with XRE-family HTH domain
MVATIHLAHGLGARRILYASVVPRRLDVDFVVSRRLELGLSHWDIERGVGSSLTTIRGIEDGRNHAKVTLDVLLRVADALQVPAARLLPAPHRERPEPSYGPGGPLADDALQVGQLLLAAGKQVLKSALAGTLDWNLARTNQAIDAVRRHLDDSPSLLRMTTTTGRVGLVPRDDVVTAEQWRSLRRKITAVDELRITAARMLSAVVTGT